MKIDFKIKKTNDFAKILVKYASSQVLGNLLRMIAGFLTVRLIAPDIYGNFTGKGIFIGYLSLAHLGILNGLNRELPVENGRGNINKVKELASVGFWVSLLIGIPSSITLVVLGIIFFFNNDIQGAILYFTYATSAFFLLLNKFYLPVLYRTNQDFTKLTKITIYTSIINIITVVFVWWQQNIEGLCVRLVILNFVEFVFLYLFRPIKVNPQWSLPAIKQLFKIGVPIYVVGYIGLLWETIKNNIIFSLGGGLQYGYYALSSVVSGAVGMIPSSFSQIIYPKMAIAYGKGESKKSIVQAVYKPTLLLLVICISIAIVGYFLLEPIVIYFLPKYSSGIDAALWSMLLPIVNSPALLNNYFNVYKRQVLFLIGIIAGISISTIYIYLYNYFFGFTLALFPQSLLIGTLTQNFICWLLIIRDVRKVQ